MPKAGRLLHLLVVGGGVLATGAPAALVVACADSEPGESAASDAGPDLADATSAADRAVGPEDAGPRTTCAITRDYFEACGNGAELNCGEDFDAWCEDNDRTINSAAYRRAEEACLTTDHCDGNQRRACEYAHYDEETPTSAQAALVAAYCATCEPGDPAGCKARATHYDASKGPKAVPDVFVAAWELSDALAQEITTKCTGGDASADAGTCAREFASCSADVYLAHLPDCPKQK
jgi:hypothetical protein